MRILLSNDDGVLAPGLAAMYETLSELGDVTVVAPETPQSAAAHGITLHGPLPVRRIHVQEAFHAWSVDGRPADCVKLAAVELLPEPPDLVVSGINDGANVSINVLYSGTVAAAAEGALLGFPAVAVSLERGVERDFRQAASIALDIIRQLLDGGLAAGELVNVNIPDLTPGPPRGVRVVPMGTRVMEDRFHRFAAPDGRDYYWFGGGAIYRPAGSTAASDLDALHERCVAVTPLQFDLTRYPRMEDMSRQKWNLGSGHE